jgi:hypothetical protein
LPNVEHFWVGDVVLDNKLSILVVIVPVGTMNEVIGTHDGPIDVLFDSTEIQCMYHVLLPNNLVVFVERFVQFHNIGVLSG